MNNVREKVETTVNKVNDTNFSINNGKVHIFPFIIRNGYQNVSERGFEDKSASSYWFSFFQKVFTGRETITATWEGSTQLNVRDASLGTYNYDFQVGKYYEGMIVPGSLTQSIDIDSVNGNDAFLAMQESSEVTIVFSRNTDIDLSNEYNTTDFIPTEDDLYKLYIIPETTLGNKWLYISNVTTYVNPKNSSNILTEVTFSSLKDKLEQSGRSLEQYVQYSAPGEPYAFPYINYEGEVDISPFRGIQRYFNQIKYLQVELQGASALSSITILGRRLYWDDENEKFYTSPGKFLFPAKLVGTQANPLNKTAAPSKNFYCFCDETIDIRSTDEWLTAMKNQNNAIAPEKNMGAFTMEKNSTWTSNTQSGVHQSNPLTGSHHWDYYDTSWKPLQREDSSFSYPNHNVAGNLYTTDAVQYTATDSMIQTIIKNGIVNWTQWVLPLDMTQTKPQHWSMIPVIGFWTRWAGDRTFNTNTVNISTNHLCYFIDTSLATLAYNAFNQTGDNVTYSNLQMFNGEDAPSMLNPQSTNTTLCFTLTDLIRHTDYVTNQPVTTDSVYFSQVKDENGNWLHTDHSPMLLNASDGVMNPVECDYGFIIDNIIISALFVGKIKISCYSDYGVAGTAQPQFTQTVLSNSMFEEHNIRNWTTNLTLGTWDSSWSNGEITWPLEPQKQGNPALDISFVGHNFEIEGEDQHIAPFREGKAVAKHRNEWDMNKELPVGYWENKTGYLHRELSSDPIFEQTFTFAQLPVEGITDVTTFKQKIDKLYLDATGSYIKFEYTINGKKNNITSSAVSKGILINVNELQEGVVYSGKCNVCSINANIHNPLHNIEWYPSDDREKFRMLYQDITSLSGPRNAGWMCLIKYEITLSSSGLKVKVWGDPTFIGYDLPGITGALQLFYLSQKDNTTKIYSQSKINNVQLIQKQS